MKTSGKAPRVSILVSVLSGLMLTASFPPATTDWFAWFALVPLLAAMQHQSPSRCFQLGFIAGAAHFLSLMYWIIVVLGKYGGLNSFLSLSILVALCLYLALYPGLFGLLFSFLRDSRFRLLLMAGAWVCLEYLRGRLFTGLPWCFIGHSQAARLHLIQICDLVGAYGLSFLVAAVNILVFEIIFDRRTAMRTDRMAQTAFVMLLLLLTLYYGGLKLRGTPAVTLSPVRTAIVQGNIDQSEKWIPEFQEKTIASYRRLSLQAARTEPDLIVWPETAVPLFFQDASPLSARIINIPEHTGADLLFGSPAYVESGNEVRYTNRAYLLLPEDRAIRTYDKVHLVPFGEYVPLQRFLPFVNRLVPAAGDFVPGGQIAPLSAGRYAAGVLICYEAIFPHLARRQVEEGADILVNLTNDAWFGQTSAPFQHLSMSVFRAVETRLPLVRAANTGISAFVDPKGRIIRKGGLFREAVLVSDILPSEQGSTFYADYGHLFPLFLLVVISVILINSALSRLIRRSAANC
ncbi:MAG: apolipoprotein N-acyltransferase [Thermodesulfobacteriota bacterium]